MVNIKTCSILYGYSEKFLDNINQESPIIIIEPRSQMIDKVKTLKHKNIILISKLLVHDIDYIETTFYCKSGNYYLECNKYDKRYITYTITPETIISEYKIQNIEQFIVNLNISNITNVLDNLISYNHIISNIIIKCDNPIESKIMNFYNNNGDGKYSHKNLKMKLPNIGLYFLTDSMSNFDNLELLVNQYKMNVVVNDVIVSYPKSVTVLKENINLKVDKVYFQNIVNILTGIFNNANSTEDVKVDDLDIIIQFNPKYFLHKKTLQIMYPIRNDTIYINRVYDVMYATKDCMYMIYQILNSKYFTDYINVKKNERPKFFTTFSKKYFYEYLEKIFVFKEF